MSKSVFDKPTKRNNSGIGKKMYYVRNEYQEGEDAWDDIYPFKTAQEAIDCCEGMRKENAYSISQGCMAVYYCDKYGNQVKKPEIK